MNAIIRKIVTVVEETHLEMGQKIAPPTRRAAAIAVIENPFAGRYVEDLSPLIAIGEELGELLSKKAVEALGIDGAKAHSYGKAAAVGENGELEHAAAILHPKMGTPVRKVTMSNWIFCLSAAVRGGSAWIHGGLSLTSTSSTMCQSTSAYFVRRSLRGSNGVCGCVGVTTQKNGPPPSMNALASFAR